jgi:hypothetical protein
VLKALGTADDTTGPAPSSQLAPPPDLPADETIPGEFAEDET